MFTAFTMLSCGDGLYQQAPKGVASSKSLIYVYIGHGESIPFVGEGLKGAEFTISPALPAGLSLDSNLPGIVGTPSETSTLTEYSVHMHSDFGQADFTFELKVNLASPVPSQLRDIFAGGSSTPSVLGRLGEEIIFAAEDAADGIELWKTDGTTAGTVQIQDIENGATSSAPTSLWQAQNPNPFSDVLLFMTDIGGGNLQLWRTDGTGGGTAVATALEPTGLAKLEDGGFVVGMVDGVLGLEPFAVDASGANAVNLADIAAGGDSSPEYFTELNGGVFFFASDQAAVSGKEPYFTDGTPAGTVLLRDINAGTGDSLGSWAPVSFNDYVYFGADDGVNGFELWRSDGTTAGTALVKDISSGPTSSDPGNFVVFNNILYFTADDNIHGLELWRTDGTSSGTYIVKNIDGTANGSSVTLFAAAVASHFFYFTADNGSSGEELWRSDGTSAGTYLIKDLDGVASGSAPLQLTMVGDFLFFSATTGARGRELWKSNGTSAGTSLVADIYPGANDGIQSSDVFFEFEGVLYFPAQSGATDIELYKVTPY